MLPQALPSARPTPDSRGKEAANTACSDPCPWSVRDGNWLKLFQNVYFHFTGKKSVSKVGVACGAKGRKEEGIFTHRKGNIEV